MLNNIQQMLLGSGRSLHIKERSKNLWVCSIEIERKIDKNKQIDRQIDRQGRIEDFSQGEARYFMNKKIKIE